MGNRTLLTILVAGSLLAPVGRVESQVGSGAPLEARLWVGWEDEPLVRRGEQVRIQYRTSHDAYVAVFRIDTDGRVALLSPVDPWDDGLRPGGRDEELRLATSPYWTVTDDPGMGYMFLVASPVPLDFSRFRFHPEFGWDLSAVASTVYDDPYVAMDDFIAAILPDWRDVGYALDFVSYHVDEPRSYPRFLCYDCHTYQSFDEWNPYDAMCSSYRVVVYDDPYYYPVYRYAGTRVIYPMPIPDRPRYEVTARRSAKAWAPIVRVRSAPPAQVAFKESPTPTPPRRADRGSAARTGSAGAPPRASSSPRPAVTRGGTSSGGRSGSTGAVRPSGDAAGDGRGRGSAGPARARPDRTVPSTRGAAPPASRAPATRRAPPDRRVPASGDARSPRPGSRDAGASPSSRRPAVTPPSTRRSTPGSSGASGARARPSGGSGRTSPAADRGRPASSPGPGTRPTRPGTRPGPGGVG